MKSIKLSHINGKSTLSNKSIGESDTELIGKKAKQQKI